MHVCEHTQEGGRGRGREKERREREILRIVLKNTTAIEIHVNVISTYQKQQKSLVIIMI